MSMNALCTGTYTIHVPFCNPMQANCHRSPALTNLKLLLTGIMHSSAYQIDTDCSSSCVNQGSAGMLPLQQHRHSCCLYLIACRSTRLHISKNAPQTAVRSGTIVHPVHSIGSALGW
jgi:hypothetical protein